MPGSGSWGIRRAAIARAMCWPTDSRSRAQYVKALEVVGEINGRYQPTDDEESPPGTDSRAAMRVGARFTHRTVRIDGGIVLGMTTRDPSLGITAGVTWVFRGFSVP